jgi:hypothetical protein
MRNLTRRQAEQALAAVKEHFAGILVNAGEASPVLYPPGHEGNSWVISWEEGPPDWNREDIPLPAGTYRDRPNHWCLSLYRD